MSNDNPYTTPEADLSAPLEGGVVLAGRWARLFGALVDAIITAAVMLPLMYFIVPSAFEDAWTSWSDALLVLVLNSLVFLGVNGYLLHNRGQSVGKFLLRTQIIAADSEYLLPLQRIFLYRWLPIIFISQIPFINLLTIVNVLFIFGDDKRCVHDHIAGTRVAVYAARRDR